jgi:hypothetical protein
MEKTYTLNLTETEVNVVLNALGSRPYAEVQNLIPGILNQAQSQAQQGVQEPAELTESIEL